MVDISEMTEAELWKRWLEQEESIIGDELIRRYMPLVHYHVQRISVGLPKSVSKDELVSHGLIGLYDAISKFNLERNLKFDTYASFRVRGAIIDGLRKEDWLPRTMREKIKKIEKATELLQQTYGRTVSSEEIAEEVHLEQREVEQLMSEHYFSNLLSIDEKNNESERDETYAATIIDTNTLTPEQYMMEQNVKDELEMMIEQLSEQEQLVVSLYYFDEMSLTEIAEILQLSTSRISQIHSKAIFRMQQAMKKKE